MCTEPNRRLSLGGVLTAAGVLAASALAYEVLKAVVPFLLPLGAVAVALAAGSVPVLRWARRFSVVSWPSRQPQAAVTRAAVVQARAAVREARQTALPAGTSLMLEQARPVVHAVITEVKEKAHVR